MNLNNRQYKRILSLISSYGLCLALLNCTGNKPWNKHTTEQDSTKEIALANEVSVRKNGKEDNRQELDQFLGSYKSFCRKDDKVYLTLDIAKEEAGYTIKLKSFPGNYIIVEEIAKPDTVNFDKQLDVWSVTDKKDLTYGFIFNKKYLTELFMGCIVLDNVDYKPTIDDCFIQDKQDNIVFCKDKKN